MTVQNTFVLFLLLSIEQTQAITVSKGLSIGSSILSCNLAAVLAEEAVGPNAKSGESSKLMSYALSAALKYLHITNSKGAKNDGLVWGEADNKTIELENTEKYVDTMEEWFIHLNNANPESGIVSGNQRDGFGPGLDEKLEMHIFDGYGVADHHFDFHSSLAILWKRNTYDDQFVIQKKKFVMMKIDLQTPSGDVASGQHDKIVILHEIKIVDGINRRNWDMDEKYVSMSITQLFKILKKTIDNTPKIYGYIDNNCIQFKNNILTNMKAFEKSIADHMVPEKKKPKDTALLGYKKLFC